MRPPSAAGMVLEARNVSVRFQSVNGRPLDAVSGASFEVPRGQVTAIVGESGSGKTQLLGAILGLTRGVPGLVAGSATFHPDGQTSIPLIASGSAGTATFVGDHRVLRHHLAVIFQGVDSHLNPFHRVDQQFLRKARLLGQEQVVSKDGPAKYVARQLAPLFPNAGDPARIARSYPTTLSGGEKARVAICLALSSQARVLIADEPTTGLDPGLRFDIYQRLRQDILDKQRSLLIVSHDVDLVARLADQIYVMKDGRIVERSDGGRPEPESEYSNALFRPLPGYQKRGTECAARARRTANDERASSDNRPRGAKNALLRVQGLRKHFVMHGTNGTGSAPPNAVDSVNLEVSPGEALGIVGESGSGKSTLARLIAGLIEPDSGDIALRLPGWAEDLPIDHPEYRRHVQILHQNPDVLLHPKADVDALCQDSIRLWRDRSRYARVEDVLEFASLGPRVRPRRPGTLSGGERRRLSLARVLTSSPHLLIADEIVSGLDRVMQKRMFDHLSTLRREGLTIILISHDLDIVRKLCDRVMVMLRGAFVDEMPASLFTLGTRDHHPYTRYLLEAEALDPDRPPTPWRSVP